MKNKESIPEIDYYKQKEMAFMDRENKNFFSEKFSLIMDSSPYIDMMKEPRYTPEYRMAYLKEGTAVHSINFKDYNLKAGDMVLVSPRNIISLKSASDNYVQQVLAIDIPELQYLKIPACTPMIIHLSDNDKEIVEQLFDIINNILRSRGPQSNILRQIIMSLISMIIDIDSETSKGSGYKHLSREEEITEEFKKILASEQTINRRVSHFSDKMKLTDSYLNTVIKKITEHTVMYWIDQKTVYFSKMLLQDKDLPLETVAIESGFKTVAQFCKFFKTKTGITPSEYRNNVKSFPY